MAHGLFVALAVCALAGTIGQGEAQKLGGEALLGTWASTTVPRRGEAPAIAPTFEIRARDNKLVIVLAGKGEEPTEPVVFRASGSEYILLVRARGVIGSADRTLVIRPIGPDELRFEVFTEYSPNSNRNFFYAETFKRVK